MWYDKPIAQNKVPDFLARKGIVILKQRLKDENKGDVEAQQAHLMALIDKLNYSPLQLTPLMLTSNIVSCRLNFINIA